MTDALVQVRRTPLALAKTTDIHQELTRLSSDQLERLELYVLAQTEATRLHDNREATEAAGTEVAIAGILRNLPLDIVAQGLAERVYEEPISQALVKAQESVLDLKEQAASELERILLSIATAVKANPKAYKGPGSSNSTVQTPKKTIRHHSAYTTKLQGMNAGTTFVPDINITYNLIDGKSVQNKELPFPTLWQRFLKDSYTSAKEEKITISVDLGYLTSHKNVNSTGAQNYSGSNIQVTYRFLNDSLIEISFNVKLDYNPANTPLNDVSGSALGLLESARMFMLQRNPSEGCLYSLNETAVPQKDLTTGRNMGNHYHYTTNGTKVGLADILHAIRQIPERLQQYQKAQMREQTTYLSAVQGK
ncbi:MAG: hypothetical protein WC254_03105 [Candidatus Woesearchaeota archaeon]|jgi:hypothetical protein